MGSKLSGLEGMEPWVLCLVLCYLVTAMTEVISNAAVCTLMMPLISALVSIDVRRPLSNDLWIKRLLHNA